MDFFGVGEHHRPDFAISAPEVLLAAIAGRTERLRLGTAVTVLSSDDPIRVYQRFSTLNAVSERPRRGDPGPRLVHRIVPALRLLARRLQRPVRGEARHLRGTPGRRPHRPAGPVEGDDPPAARRRPRLPAGRAPAAQHLGGCRRQPGVGGPRGALRLSAHARHHRRRPAPLRALRRALPPRPRPARARTLPVGVHSPGHIAETDAQAREELWPAYQVMRNRIGAERGWGPTSRAEFDQRDRGGLAVRRLARDGRPQDRRDGARPSARPASISSTARARWGTT